MKTIHEATETLTNPTSRTSHGDGVHTAYASLRMTLIRHIRIMHENTRPAWGATTHERTKMLMKAEIDAHAAKAIANAMVRMVSFAGMTMLYLEAEQVREWVNAEADAVIGLMNETKAGVLKSITEKYLPRTPNPLPDGRYSATGVLKR